MTGSPAFYAYRMTTPDGHRTNGVIGALGLDPASTAEIFPHEETLSKAKTDRLELIQATRTNISPIWGLSLSAGLTKTFERHERPRCRRHRPGPGPPRALGASTIQS